MRYHEDDPFNATELLRTQFALDDSLYFSTVEVLPEERDRENSPCPSASTPNPIAGIATSTAWVTVPTRRCAAPSPGKTGASTTPGTASARKSARPALAQSIDAAYIVPIGDPAIEKFTLALSGEHERLADIDDQSINFTPGLTHVRRSWFGNNYWQRVTYLEFSTRAPSSSSRTASRSRRC
jgi:hypothetical protein